MAGNDGTKLEGKVQDALKAYCSGHLALWYRFPDTKAARNIIANQPGDFMLVVPKAAILLECKSTYEGASLFDLLDSTQVAKHRLWHRAKHPSVFVYGDMRKGVVTFYDGRQVAKQVVTKKAVEGLAFLTVPLQELPDAVELLINYCTRSL